MEFKVSWRKTRDKRVTKGRKEKEVLSKSFLEEEEAVLTHTNDAMFKGWMCCCGGWGRRRLGWVLYWSSAQLSITRQQQQQQQLRLTLELALLYRSFASLWTLRRHVLRSNEHSLITWRPANRLQKTPPPPSFPLLLLLYCIWFILHSCWKQMM